MIQVVAFQYDSQYHFHKYFLIKLNFCAHFCLTIEYIEWQFVFQIQGVFFWFKWTGIYLFQFVWNVLHIFTPSVYYVCNSKFREKNLIKGEAFYLILKKQVKFYIKRIIWRKKSQWNMIFRLNVWYSYNSIFGLCVA